MTTTRRELLVGTINTALAIPFVASAGQKKQIPVFPSQARAINQHLGTQAISNAAIEAAAAQGEKVGDIYITKQDSNGSTLTLKTFCRGSGVWQNAETEILTLTASSDGKVSAEALALDAQGVTVGMMFADPIEFPKVAALAEAVKATIDQKETKVLNFAHLLGAGVEAAFTSLAQAALPEVAFLAQTTLTEKREAKHLGQFPISSSQARAINKHLGTPAINVAAIKAAAASSKKVGDIFIGVDRNDSLQFTIRTSTPNTPKRQTGVWKDATTETFTLTVPADRLASITDSRALSAKDTTVGVLFAGPVAVHKLSSLAAAIGTAAARKGMKAPALTHLLEAYPNIKEHHSIHNLARQLA